MRWYLFDANENSGWPTVYSEEMIEDMAGDDIVYDTNKATLIEHVGISNDIDYDYYRLPDGKYIVTDLVGMPAVSFTDGKILEFDSIAEAAYHVDDDNPKLFDE